MPAPTPTTMRSPTMSHEKRSVPNVRPTRNTAAGVAACREDDG